MCLYMSEYLLASEPLIIAGQSRRYRERGRLPAGREPAEPLRPSLGRPFEHVLLAHVEPHRVVHDAVHDGVGVDAAASRSVTRPARAGRRSRSS